MKYSKNDSRTFSLKPTQYDIQRPLTSTLFQPRHLLPMESRNRPSEALQFGVSNVDAAVGGVGGCPCAGPGATAADPPNGPFLWVGLKPSIHMGGETGIALLP